MNLTPRNDYVLFRRVNLGETPAGIKVPEGSIEGIKHVVVACGPDVKDLKQEDEILVIGQIKVDYMFLPNSKDLLLTKQANIVMVVK